jgi:tetratricopeptide (TPR) repeat protein
MSSLQLVSTTASIIFTMKNILLLMPLLFFSNRLFCQGTPYHSYSQGSNYGNGPQYVAPIVTTTWNFNYTTYTPPVVYSYGNGNGGSQTGGQYYSTSGYGSGGPYLYRNTWLLKYEQRQREELLKIKAIEVAAKAWKEKADEVMLQYSKGNFLEAEKIRRSFSFLAPEGVGDIVKLEDPDPNLHDRSMLLGYPFQKKYENRYAYVEILLMAELKEYAHVKEYYEMFFTESEIIKFNRAPTPNVYKYTYNWQEQTPKLIEIFKDFTYPEILKLESAYIEALKHESGKPAARKYWTEVSNFYVPYIKAKVTDTMERSRCFNNIAMVQLQLGLIQDAITNFKKQLILTPNNYQAQFSVLQNIVEYAMAGQQKDSSVMQYCLDGFNHILNNEAARADKDFIYAVNYNKAVVLITMNDNKNAYKVLFSQKYIPARNSFSHQNLQAQVLVNLDSFNRFNELTAEMVHRYSEQSDTQRTVFGNMLAEFLLKGANEYEQAEKNYLQAMELMPSNWAYPLRLAEIYAHQNKDKEAITLLGNTINNFPDEYQLYLELADEYLKTKQTKKAKANYRLAVEKGAEVSPEINKLIEGK